MVMTAEQKECLINYLTLSQQQRERESEIGDFLPMGRVYFAIDRLSDVFSDDYVERILENREVLTNKLLGRREIQC